MLNGVFCWYDKIDKVYMPGTFMLNRSERAVCRGFLQEFERDKRMNPAEFSLYRIGTFDDETGQFVLGEYDDNTQFVKYDKPRQVDPSVVFAKQGATDGAVVEE